MGVRLPCWRTEPLLAQLLRQIRRQQDRDLHDLKFGMPIGEIPAKVRCLRPSDFGDSRVYGHWQLSTGFVPEHTSSSGQGRVMKAVKGVSLISEYKWKSSIGSNRVFH